ncbi:MAG: class I SAM-dependent methyltransferase [Janthinobacterium lividum]
MPRLLGFLSRYIFGIFSCVYLFTLGLLQIRNRELISAISRHFGFGVTKAKLPLVSLNALVIDDSLLQISEPVAQDGNVSALELISIIKLIKKYQPYRLFEMGTFDGRTTLNMAANSAEAAEIFTLDLPKSASASAQLRLEVSDRKYIDKEISGAKYRGTEVESKITQLYGDSATYDFSPFFNSIDFIFVDAAHSYEYVLNDSKIALKMLSGGKGIILWHDYGIWEGVTKALDQLLQTVPEFRDLKHIEGTTLACLIIRS